MTDKPDSKTVFRNGIITTLTNVLFVNQAMSILVRLAEGSVKHDRTAATFTVDGKLLDDITALTLAFARFDTLNPNYKTFLDVSKQLAEAKKAGKPIDPEIDKAIEMVEAALVGPLQNIGNPQKPGPDETLAFVKTLLDQDKPLDGYTLQSCCICYGGDSFPTKMEEALKCHKSILSTKIREFENGRE